MEIKILPNEAGIVAKYLLDRSLDEKERTLYVSFLRMKGVALSEKEQRLWSLMLANKFVFYFFDSGLAFFYPQCAIRQRILFMLGVLETQPRLASGFLASKTSSLLLFTDVIKASLTLPLIPLSGLVLKIYFR